MCPYYEKWKQMLRRCYSQKEKDKNPGYQEVTCVPEWLSLSNFKSWMVVQEYRFYDGTMLELDKDMLFKDNKIYGPDTCVFLHHKVNSFIFRDEFHSRNHPLGVTYDKRTGKYQAQCLDPFKYRSRHICYGFDPHELHLKYLGRKHQYACELADSEYVTDKRVAEALRKRYSYDNWYKQTS